MWNDIALLAVVFVVFVVLPITLYVVLCKRTDAKKDGPGVEDTNGDTARIKVMHYRGYYQSRNVVEDPDDTSKIVARARGLHLPLILGLFMLALAGSGAVGALVGTWS